MNDKPLRRKRGGSPTDEFPLVTRIHDVVNSTGIMKWHFPSHRNWSELRGDLQRFEGRGVGGTEYLTPLFLGTSSFITRHECGSRFMLHLEPRVRETRFFCG